MVFSDINEIQAFINGAMSNKFPREPFQHELIKVYLDTRINATKQMIPHAQKTLLVKRIIGSNTHITVGFLDNNNKVIFTPDSIPHGIEITAPSIDSEISDLFGNHDSIIYE